MNNNVLTIGFLTLIIGIFAGYFISDNPQQMMNDVREEDNDYAYEDHEEELISGDGAMQHAMEEMMLDFRGMSGEDFEKAFLEGMIVHHIGAIEMAEQLLDETDRPELVKMANDIIDVQTQEVDMMKGWLEEWYEDENENDITVYKSASCGCCREWSSYMEDFGYSVENINTQDLSAVKEEHGVPYELESCHTAIVGDYVVEGHIPNEAVQKLLSENPDIKGIGMAGMPSGSPGMPGPKEDFMIYEINHDGTKGDMFMRL